MMMDNRIDPTKQCAEIVDKQGRIRGLLEDQGNHWFYAYLAPHFAFVGAGRTLQAAIEMIEEKSGMTVEALPPIKRSVLRVEKGPRHRINGFQGGGFYQHIFYYLGTKCLGSFYVKEQPARRRSNAHTSVGEACVMGHDLAWMLRMNGYRLVEG
jgi:hypothetical protein